MDSTLPGPSVHGILQARILEWAAILPPEALPNPRIRVSFIAGGFFTAEPVTGGAQ